MRLFWLGMLLFTQMTNAADPSLNSKFTVEAGLLFTNIRKVAYSPTGSKSLLPNNQFLLSVSSRMGTIRPELGFTFIPREGSNDSHLSRTLLVSIPFVFESSTVAWKAGLTYWMHMITGGGGNVTLSNGGTTAVYSRPGRNETQKSIAIDLGVTIPVVGKVVLDTDLYLMSLLSSRRSFNLLVQVGWAVL